MFVPFFKICFSLTRQILLLSHIKKLVNLSIDRDGFIDGCVCMKQKIHQVNKARKMFLKDFIVVVMIKPTFSPLAGESEGSRPAVYTNDLPGGAAEGCD